MDQARPGCDGFKNLSNGVWSLPIRQRSPPCHWSPIPEPRC